MGVGVWVWVWVWAGAGAETEVGAGAGAGTAETGAGAAETGAAETGAGTETGAEAEANDGSTDARATGILIRAWASRVEMMVDAYLLDAEATTDRVKDAQDYLVASDAELMHHLDKARNRLIRMMLVIMTVTTGAASAAFFVSLFAMNLVAPFNDEPIVWYVVTAIAILGTCVFVWLVTGYVQRRAEGGAGLSR